eukprot:CAMPEP_0167822818 /NCGR_PEP_ID=MMETSP0112_2-20121227/7747_1 /TAXON_ID=91324 /ORGANISM="Lotharella globosa, Strain CCCM811" /LENGTH=116 /DNA_ID=CAMNT_0007724307 /DNA_START=180 /DNA_END=526 /DNA_ORIENTATION=+
MARWDGPAAVNAEGIALASAVLGQVDAAVLSHGALDAEAQDELALGVVADELAAGQVDALAVGGGLVEGPGLLHELTALAGHLVHAAQALVLSLDTQAIGRLGEERAEAAAACSGR